MRPRPGEGLSCNCVAFGACSGLQLFCQGGHIPAGGRDLSRASVRAVWRKPQARLAGTKSGESRSLFRPGPGARNSPLEASRARRRHEEESLCLHENLAKMIAFSVRVAEKLLEGRLGPGIMRTGP